MSPLACLVGRLAWRALVVVLLVTGCAGIRPSEDTIAARALREQLFTDTLDSYRARTPEEAEALRSLAAYRRALDASDRAALGRLLAPDFELRHYPGAGRVEVQDPRSFLAARAAEKGKPGPNRRLSLAILGAHCDAKAGRCAVTALATYRSKYFSPRFLEAFVLEARSGSWLLRRVLAYPLHPGRPEGHRAQVFFSEYASEQRRLRGLDREFLADGPDAVLDRYLRMGKTVPAAGRGQQGPLVIIFAEPPPDGSRIEVVEEQLQAFGGGRLSDPSRYRYPSSIAVQRGGNPHFFLLGNGWWGHAYSVAVRVTLDGAVVADEILAIR